MSNLIRNLVLSMIALSVVACGNSNPKNEQTYPKTAKEKRIEEVGSVAGEEGIVLFGGKSKSSSSSIIANNVNGYLWRATLDTISFMPLMSTDPVGGVIITDWYQDPTAPKERFKLNILILTSDLQSNGVKVSVFKQTQDNRGSWHDAATSKQVAADLEDKILTRARQLKIAASS
jgi:hypothetical protein